ncbi:TetR/AcrR family transcriptional regulator [Corynebacterium lubricantis]|uniref:TetR/AcrR family transcriptional regulator n=1 Tax=Corynebacterium lubricantis TaxID=541095 RepID=UPI0003827286|nr:TetR/AcrR family transcriptional regulator [Corynebacterium lubricantis]
MPIISEDELIRRRQEILDGARKCFAEFGYEGATVRLLEEATGKSRGAIFHHFGDKESLFLEIAREDAQRQADVVSEGGLVEVMRDMLRHPERYDWLATRIEIVRKLRSDPDFKSRWHKHQEVLDQAVAKRLRENASNHRMRTDVPMEVLHLYLTTFMDGFITRLASGESTEHMEAVLDLVEQSVRALSYTE